ncbi:MAG: HEAT repeat domain-containing protein [Armatimonadetes bacterium]|nr:HEAT repeat domain-containing protein [Armatimonadota bacterium]
MSADREYRNPGEAAGQLSRDVAELLWPVECGHFDQALARARGGFCTPMALVADAGRGKTWLLGSLIQAARLGGDPGLHLHLDRYFSLHALVSHGTDRLFELNPDLRAIPVPATSGIDALLELFSVADATVASTERGFVLGLSGLEACVDGAPDSTLVDAAIALVHAAQRNWRHTLLIVELRPQHLDPSLDAVSHAGLVYFPMSEPADAVVERVLASAARGLTPFAPSVVPMASARARGNLHRLVAAMRSISARASAAGIERIEPLQWEALASGSMSEEISVGASAERRALLAAIVDWPAAGFIPLDSLLWRLRVQEAVRTEEQFEELLADLKATVPLLGLEVRGRVPHLRFEWLELRRQATRAALDDSDPDTVVARRRLQALIASGLGFAAGGDGEKAIEALSDAVAGSGDPQFAVFRRQAAALASAMWRGEYPVDAVHRAAAAPLLVETAGASACGPLIEVMEEDDPALVAASQDALASLGEAAVKPVSRLLGSDQDALRFRAIAVLSRIPVSASLEALTPLLGAADTELIAVCLDALRKLAMPEAGASVLPLVEHQSPEVRADAIATLAELAYVEALPAVATALSDESEAVRAAASACLSSLGDERAIPTLVGRLCDPDCRGAQAIAGALASFGAPALAALLDATVSQEPSCRIGAIRGLCAFPADQAVEPLLSLLADEDERVWQAAQSALADFAAEAVEPVAALMGAGDARERRLASGTLVLIGEAAVPALISRLTASDARVREEAAWALGSLEWEPAAPDLARLLGDPDPSVRIASIQALRNIGSDDALAWLVGSLSDSVPEVTSAASEAISSFGTRALTPLLAALTDSAGSPVSGVADALVALGQEATLGICDALPTAGRGWKLAGLQVLDRLRDPECLPFVTALLADSELGRAPADLLLSFGDAAMPLLFGLLDNETLAPIAADLAVEAGPAAVSPAIAALGSDDPRVRMWGAHILGRLHPPEAVDGLLGALTDVDVQVRTAAVIALGAIADPRALEAMAALTRDPEPSVVVAAAESIQVFGQDAARLLVETCRIDDDRDLLALLHVIRVMGDESLDDFRSLLTAADASVRARAARVLAAIPDDVSIPGICRLLADPDEAVAQDALAAVVRLGNAAVPALVQLLLDESEALRTRALDALVELGPSSLPQVVALLRDENRDVRKCGAWAASAFGDVAVAPVADVLAGSSDPSVRQSAATCLARIGTSDAVNALISALTDSAESVRVTVVRCLEHVGDPRAVPGLLRVAATCDGADQQAASRALLGFGPEAVPALAAALAEAASPEGCFARELLTEMGEVAVDGLIEALSGATPAHQAALIQVLSATGPEKSAPRVLDLLAADPPAGQAAQAFARTHYEHCMGGLVRRVGSEQPGFSEAACQVLAEVGGPSVEPLATLCMEGPEKARALAARLLGDIGEPTALPALLELLSAPVGALRVEAVAALLKIGDPQALAPLVDAFADPDRIVAHSAFRALDVFGIDAAGAAIRRHELDTAPVPPWLPEVFELPGSPALELFETLLASDDPALRAGAVRAIWSADQDRLGSLLPGLLSDPSPRVQELLVDCCRTLGALIAPDLLGALTGEDPAARDIASRCLVAVGPGAVGVLLDALSDAAQPRRAQLVRVLEQIRDPEAVKPLVEVLDDVDEELAGASVEALVAFGQASVGPLLDQLESPNELMRLRVPETLRRLGDVVRPALVELVGAAEPARAAAALEVVRRMGASEVLPALVSRLGDDPKIAGPAAEMLLEHTGQAIPLLCEGLDSDAEMVRGRCGELLVQIGGPALGQLSVTLLEGGVQARVASASAVARIGTQAAVEPLALAMADDDPRVRYAAASGLEMLGAVAPLVRSIDDPHTGVRERVTKALVSLGEPALSELVAAQASPEKAPIPALLEVLRAFGELANEHLERALMQADGDGRAKAIRCLGALGSTHALPIVTGLLADPDSRVRQAAGEVLVASGRSAVKPLVDALVSDRSDLHEPAADCLRQIGLPAAQALIDVANAAPAAGWDDASPWARSRAIEVLADIQPDGLGEHLTRRVRDTAETVRVAAARAIQKIGHADAVPVLLEGIDDDTPAARDARLAALCSFGQVAVPTLIEKMENPAWAGSPALAAALASLGEVVEDAIVSLLDDPSPERRLLAARTLHDMRLERAAHGLYLRTSDTDERVRLAAALALAQLPPEHASPLLADLSSPDEALRRHAVAALAVQSETALDQAAAKVVDPDPVARRETLRLLHIIARDKDRDAVLGALGDPDPDVRVEAIHASLNWPDEPLAHRLADLLADPWEPVVEAASGALRELGPVAHPALIQRLLDQQGRLDPVVARVFGLPAEEALDVLRRGVGADSPVHRERCLRALALAGTDGDLILLARAMDDSEDSVADAAANCLLAAGERAIPPAASAFRAGSERGIARATRVLADLYPASRAVICEALVDESAAVRLRALNLLAGQDEASDAPVIAERLSDDTELVRVAAANALARLGSVESVPALLDGLDADTPASAAARHEAVATIGAPAVPAVLDALQLAEWRRDSRVAAIARALGGDVERVARDLLEAELETERVRGLRILDLLDCEDRLDVCARMAVDASADVRAEVVRVLRSLGEEGARALLPGLAYRDETHLPRLAECLVALGDSALDLVRDQLGSPVGETRFGAVEVLALAGRAGDAEALAGLLDDPEPDIRARICRLLPEISPTVAIARLTGMLGDRDRAVACTAATALASIGQPGIEALLVRVEPDSGGDQPALEGLRSAGETGLETVRSLLAGPVPSIRAAAATALGLLPDPGAIPMLARAAGDLDRAVQAAASASLVAFGAQAVPAVFDVLAGDDPDLRYSAADVLVAIGTASVDRLVQGLSETSGEVRAACLRTLVLIGDPRVAPSASEYLHDENEEVRAAAVLAVQKFRYEPALRGLIDGILDETEALREARAAAICSFREAAVPTLVEALAGPDAPLAAFVTDLLVQLRDVAAEPVAALLDRTSVAARLVAVRALGPMRNDIACAALARAVTDDDRQVRYEAARALALIGPSAGELLMDGLREPDPLRRSRVCEALAMHGTEVLDTVASLLTYEDLNVVLGVLETLGRSRHLAYVEHIASVLDDLREPVRVAACEALGLMGTPQAAEVLIDALYFNDPVVTAAATEALGNMQEVAYELLLPRLVDDSGSVDERILSALSASGEAAGPVLRECLGSQFATTRAAAVRGLARVAGSAAIPDLVPLLSDPEAQVRSAAAESLSAMGERAAAAALEVLSGDHGPGCLAAGDVLAATGAGLLPELLEVLRAGGPDARAGAARALGGIGDEQAVPHLVGRIRDSHAPVRAEAARALGLLHAATAAPHLLSAIDDPDPAVSRAAIDALGRIGAPAADALLKRLITPDGAIRDDVVYALVGIGTPCIEPLAQLAETGGTVARAAQMRVLTLIGGDEAVGPLVDGLFDEASEVRTEAMRGIQAVGRPAVGALVERLKAAPGRVAVDRIATALARLREAALPDVVALLESPDEGITRVAADILGQMGMVAAAALRRSLTHRKPNVRTLALNGLARIGDVSVVPDIIERLQDTDTGVVGAAIRALADLQDPRGIRPIAGCVGSDSPEIRDALSYAVPRFGSSIAPSLADMLTDPNEAVREHAARALVMLEKGALQALERKLRSEDTAMRAAAARVMGDLGISGVIDPLVGRLGDREAEVRQAAAEALGKIGGPAVAPTLLRMREQDERVDDGILRTLHAMTVDPVYTLTQYARDGDEEMRLAAVRMAGRYGRNEAVPTLQQRMQDTSPAINRAAAEALAAIGTHDALTALARESVTDKPELSEAIRAGLLRHAVDAIPILVRMATRPRGEPDAQLVAVAADISRSAPGIVDELLSDSDEQVRRTAALVLGDVGSSQSLRSLVRKARDPDAPVRRAAAVALGRIGGEAIGPLSALLDDDDKDVRQAAADVLAGMGDQGVHVLLQKLKSSRDHRTQAAICRSLGSAEITEAVEVLEGILKREQGSLLGVAAAGALAHMGHAVGLERLREALQSQDDEIRGEAADYLGWIGGDTALALVSKVDDPDERVRAAATRALQGLSGTDVPLLLTYAQHREAAVRLAVATALREAPGNPDALDALLRLLQDEHEDVCQAAADSLIVFGDSALDRLSNQAISDDADARYAACWALSQIGSPAVDALLSGLQRGSAEARADILRALGRIGDPRARSAVLAALDDDNPRIRVGAIGAMRRLATEDDGPRLAKALEDPDANVRMVASSVLASVMNSGLREQIALLLQHPLAETRAAAAQVLRQDAHPSALEPLRRAAAREPEPWVVELMEAAIEAIRSSS